MVKNARVNFSDNTNFPKGVLFNACRKTSRSNVKIVAVLEYIQKYAKKL